MVIPTDPPEVTEEVEIIGTYVATAAKDYTCDACGKAINKGEKYTRVSYKPGGKFKCDHYHYTC